MPDQWDAVAQAMREAVEDTVAALGHTPTHSDTPPPAAGVDLSRWKLTIPERRDGKVVEIKPPALATYSSRYFERLPDGALRFRVWHGGDTTANSPNPRSELRERVGDDPEGYWDPTEGRHELVVVWQPNRLTKVRPHVVGAQIHGGDDDLTVWRLEGTTLWITDGDDTHAYRVATDIALGQAHELAFLVEDGTVRYRYDGRTLPHTLAVDDESAFFRAGAYLQSNAKTAPGESTDEFAEVIVRSAVVTHQ